MKEKFKINLSLFLFTLLICISCSDDYTSDRFNESTTRNVTTKGANNKEQYLTNFAGILSKATYNDIDVRKFLQAASLKQFDKNYDILFYLVKDELINGKSFRDILVSYSSEEEIKAIEDNVPLLNILIPEIAFFDITPGNMDINDKEIPVAISKASETSLFLNGKEEVDLEKGEVTDFHVFVVNENSRVIIPKTATKGNSNKSIQFKSPNFDGSLETQRKPLTRSVTLPSNQIGTKAIEAFGYFNKDDGSANQMAFQRDYIYYGIHPENPSGSLNRSVTEYISYLEINPNTYFKLADQRLDKKFSNNDPYVSCDKTEIEKRELTEGELLDRLWTEGAFDFRFEIITSTNLHPQIVYIPLKPNEIWNFNLERTRRHKTMFRHTKFTYKIDPKKFTAKRIYLKPDDISFNKWNLSEESIYRYVNIVEEDESAEITYTDEYETTRVNTNRFKGDIKLDIGLGKSDKISGGVEAEVTGSNTIRELKKVNIVRKQGSDHLGSVRIYFYDPIITGREKQDYIVHTYNTGSVTFALSIK